MAKSKDDMGLAAAERNKRKTGADAYRTARLLMTCYEKLRANGATEFAACRFLSRLSNFGSFTSLQRLLEEFPKEESWLISTVDQMRRTLKPLYKRGPSKEVLALRKENAELKKEVKSLRTKLERRMQNVIIQRGGVYRAS